MRSDNGPRVAPPTTVARPRRENIAAASSLLKPAAERLAQYLKTINFSSPHIPVVNNVDVAVLNDVDDIKTALARQACHPVRWVEVIRHMASEGITHVVECGPGKVLMRMVQRIVPTLQAGALFDPASLADTELCQAA